MRMEWRANLSFAAPFTAIFMVILLLDKLPTLVSESEQGAILQWNQKKMQSCSLQENLYLVLGNSKRKSQLGTSTLCYTACRPQGSICQPSNK